MLLWFKNFIARIIDTFLMATIIYLILYFILYFRGKRTIGMFFMRLQFEPSSRAWLLMLFSWLVTLLYASTVMILFIIDVINVIKKKGWYKNRWSKCNITHFEKKEVLKKSKNN